MEGRNQNGKGGRRLIARSVALAVAGIAGTVLGTAHHAGASVVDVVLSRTGDGNTSVGNTSQPNNGITPVTYIPGTVNIPDAPGGLPSAPPSTVSYDAADTQDPGMAWNTLLCPTVSVSNTTGGNITTLYQQNIPLVNSLGTSTADLLSVSFTENNGKNDVTHNTGVTNVTNTPGSDGLLANPQLPTQAGPPNGPANVTGLMGQSWFDNGTSEIITFGMAGLIPGHAYNLYVYGSGAGNGNGGTYTVPATNQGVGYNSTTGAYTTEPNATQIFRSVFDSSSGTNPAPELGLSWTVLPVVADAGGNLSFNVVKDNGSGSKGYINGFQLDDLNVPEPASVGLLGVGSLALMLRKRGRRA